jgi:hypothetical protein
MRQMLRLISAAVLIGAATVMLAAPCLAAAAAVQSAVRPVIRQIELTEKLVQSFIGAQKEMTAVLGTIQGATTEQLPPELQAELEAVARKYGFRDFDEYDLVVDNITLVMAGMDPSTKAFTEPSVAINNEIAAITADGSIPEDEKKQMLEELREALKAVQPIQFPGNIELVRKYYDRIDQALS